MSRINRLLSAVCLGIAATAAVAAAVAAHEFAPVHKAPASATGGGGSGRVIVKFRERTTTLAQSTTSEHAGPQAAATLGNRLGLSLKDGRILGARTQVLLASGMDSAALAAAVAQDADVEWAEVDRRRFIQAAPNDPLYPNNQTTTTPVSGQWYLRAPDSTVKSGINIEPAWALTHGSSAVVIADVDTGITPHPDLDSKVDAGYDFISTVDEANDGGGRDADATDAGDWITAADDAGTTNNGDFKGCGQQNSSWHGTQTAGILGAATNNGVGMAGTGYDTMIVPARALGKCGGTDSDIIAAAEWAGGLAVSGVPTNPHPARVINMSLGGAGACGSAYQDALTALRNAHVVVVVASGNEGLAVDAPANCQPAASDPDQTPIVVAVSALRHTGSKVGFSNLGPEVTLSAPGGNCVNTASNLPCLYPILTTVNTGTTTPVLVNGGTYSNSYGEPSLGTSFSTPMVAGTVALMMSAAPNLTNGQIISLLKSTASTFPTTSDSTGVPACTAPTATVQDECICTTATCGAGMLDAGSAVTAALATTGPVAAITGAVDTLAAGSTVTLSATVTPFTGATVTDYQWTIVGGTGGATLSASTGQSVTLRGTSAGTVTVQLVATDSSHTTVTATTTTTVTGSLPSSSSGGGATSPAWLLALALAGLLLAPRRSRQAN